MTQKQSANESYSPLSIVSHWLAAILVIALFFTHEGERGSASAIFHVSGGAIAGLFLLWRVWHRVRRGMTASPKQAAVFNIASKIVMWGFLTAIVVVVLTGYFLPWSRGAPLDMFGLFSIPSPMGANRPFHEFVEEVHDIAGHLFVPLLVLHILGAAKHAFINRDGIASRMFRPQRGGL